MARVPFRPEPFVRLHQPHRAELSERQGAHAPRAVGQHQGERRGHGGESADDCSARPLARSAAAREHLDDHHVAPHEPQRHAARSRQIGPLDQHRGVPERGPEAEPGKPDVPLVAHRPFDRRPSEREHQRERQRRPAQPHPDDEPEEHRMPQAEDGDRGEVAERRQGREVPERDDQPVEHRALTEEAIPEPPAQRPPQVLFALAPAEQHHRRGDGDEAEEWELERGVARGEQDGAECDERRGRSGGRTHRSTSRPSSAERYTASSTRCTASWSRGGGAFTSPLITARK